MLSALGHLAATAGGLGDAAAAAPSSNDQPYLYWAIGAIAGLLIVAVGGVLLLRGQVRARTRRLETANRALAESELKYRELVELANSIILRWTRDGRIVFLNEFGLRFFGYTAGEIIGRRVVDTIVPATNAEGSDLAKLIDRNHGRPDLVRAEREREHPARRNPRLDRLDQQGRP